MADDILLTISVDDRTVLRSVRNQDRLRAEIARTSGGILELNRNLTRGRISQERYNTGVAQINTRVRNLRTLLNGSTSDIDRWATHVNQASRSTNRFGMYAQQVGYQVGDFFVQVQSGTSALVAFGQQGTQLAGLLPGVAGAVIGIGLSLGTMLLKTFLDTRDAGKQLEESVKAVGEALDDLSSTTSMLESTLGAPISAATERLQNYLKLLKNAKAQETFKEVSISFNQLLKEIGNGAEKLEEGSFMQKFILGTKFGPSKEDLSNSEYLLKVQGQLAEVIKGTKQQPRIVETSADIAALGDDLLAFSKKHGSVMEERIKGVLLETGLIQVMADELSTLADDQAKAGDEHNDQVKATNANLDAQLKLLMEQYEEQLKIDALIKKTHSKEKARLNDKLSIASAEYFSLKNADEGARIEKVKADIARRLFIESRKALGITGAKLQAEVNLYDAVQTQLGLNKDLTEEMAKQLALKNAIVSKTRGSLEGLGIIEGSTVSKKFYGDERAAELRAAYKALGKKGPKGKEPTTMEVPIKALKRQIELSKALFGLEGEERRRKEIFMQLQFQNRDADKKAKEEELRDLAEKVAKEEELTKVFDKQRQAQKDLADTIANSMGDALTSIVDGTKSVSDAFKDMARAIIAELYQIYVVKQITGLISSAITGYMGAGVSTNSVSGPMQSSVRPQTRPFADGGVVSRPTEFPMMGGGTGLMGEAGPEAIMPLKRGKDGKLGVQADGGSGDVIIHQNFNFQANGDESVKKIIAQQAPAIANMTKKQILDDRRRGGQMKQAFG